MLICASDPHPAYQQFGQEDNVIHQAQPGHQFPCKHKQRDRQQSKAVYALVVLLKNQLKPNLPPDSSGQDRSHAHTQSNGHTGKHQRKQQQEQINTHIHATTLPPFLPGRSI